MFISKKTFDTVDHDILLEKLNHYGIREVANNWFFSYLKNRSQYVNINGLRFYLEHIQFGAPQASILGPLLYLIYTSDLTVELDIV